MPGHRGGELRKLDVEQRGRLVARAHVGRDRRDDHRDGQAAGERQQQRAAYRLHVSARLVAIIQPNPRTLRIRPVGKLAAAGSTGGPRPRWISTASFQP
jgi:hypothetical protein